MNLPLPIDLVLGDIGAALRSHTAAVVTAPPGSGKTTRVPPFLVDAGLDGEIVVLEPRRLAARAAARRVADERGGRVGDEIGYQVRHDQRISRRTRVRFVTEGVLVRRLCADPYLEGVAAVVLDEFHERHVETDLAIAMLQEIRQTVRDDLCVLAMSATLDAEPTAAFLGGCPIVSAHGTLFDVEVRHLDRAPDPRARLEDAVRPAVRRALDETRGDVLVFLPGVGEIRRAERALADVAARAAADVRPLYGALSADDQDRAIRIGPRRRVVLSTNVAESSVTIDGVTAVVDSGQARVLRHDPARGLDALRVERISLASATQRAGRAGRTAPGICYRLWSKADERSMAPFDTPEIRRTDLAGPALVVHVFSGRAAERFDWFETPETAALQAADALLERLGAVDAAGRATDTGRAMLRLPLHPRLARAMVEGERLGCAQAVAEAAAILSDRDLLLRIGPGEPEPPIDLADRVGRLRAVERASFDAATCRAHGVDRGVARAVARARDQISRRRGSQPAAGEEAVARAILAGFVDRVVRPRAAAAEDGVMVGGRGVRWPAGALHVEAGLLVALQVADAGDRRATRSQVRLALPIERAWLDGLVRGEPRETVEAELDTATGRAIAVRRTTFLGLVLDERRGGGEPPPAAVEGMLAAQLRADPWRWIGEQRGLRSMLARVRWLRAFDPALGLPEIDDAAVADAAIALLPGRSGLRGLRDVPLAGVLTASWTAAQRRALAASAPERIALPSGRRAPIDYESGREPLLAVRLQELFGLLQSPRIGGGRVPVLLHLLAPNNRPVQVTTDLESFWANVYPSVRSELSRRYPRHAWPEDPTTATATSRPVPRRSK